MRIPFTLLAVSLLVSLNAQWEVPTRVVLDGDAPDQRQVTGLAAPTSNTAGVNQATARARTPITANATGSNTLLVDLSPAPTSLEPGLEITLIPTTPHPASVQLVVNGLGPHDVVKSGGLALDSAEMPVGMPARLLFDGQRYHLMTDAGKPCRTGFSIATADHCIADSSMAANNFREASRQCVAMNARLCSLSEWAIGCQRVPGFLATVTALEWVDHATNSQDQGKLAGVDRLTQVIGCTFGDTDAQTALKRFRCCTNR
ncbi:MAG: hypothetical protein IPN62_14405 [Flavobacteriales bacterium]|nr:hypothetical protein [Flavobacteriales bacterium]